MGELKAATKLKGDSAGFAVGIDDEAREIGRQEDDVLQLRWPFLGEVVLSRNEPLAQHRLLLGVVAGVDARHGKQVFAM